MTQSLADASQNPVQRISKQRISKQRISKQPLFLKKEVLPDVYGLLMLRHALSFSVTELIHRASQTI
jgi:hypothetical protein